MKIRQSLTADERSAIIMRGNTWAYNFLTFALLFDIMYRAMVGREGAWDLFALLLASGVFSLVYAIRHEALILDRKLVAWMALTAFVAAVIAAVVAFTYSMT